MAFGCSMYRRFTHQIAIIMEMYGNLMENSYYEFE